MERRSVKIKPNELVTKYKVLVITNKRRELNSRSQHVKDTIRFIKTNLNASSSIMFDKHADKCLFRNLVDGIEFTMEDNRLIAVGRTVLDVPISITVKQEILRHVNRVLKSRELQFKNKYETQVSKLINNLNETVDQPIELLVE
jgi:hypothetical protein